MQIELDDAEKEVIGKALCSGAVQNLMGAEEWSLSEDEENLLWAVIDKFEASGIERE